MSMVEDVLAGDRLALARLLTQIESGSAAGTNALNQLYPHTGDAQIVGITGGTGTGKSTLVNQLARHVRQVGLADELNPPQPLRVGIVAVDPTSPFSGGAILGDRIRMQDLSGDPGVFIRSMASRGALGGLARQTRPVVQALDAAGYDLIMVETVGAGQTEVEVASTAHTTIVIDAPGLGDEVQALKAGILETADILVVNKADLDGAKRTVVALRTALRLSDGSNSKATEWQVPLIETVATEGSGIPQLAQAVADHQDYLARSGGRAEREKQRVQQELIDLLQQALLDRLLEGPAAARLEKLVRRVEQRQLSPQQAVAELLEKST
jgi:LAO/AO transport system kinase